jgi:hypothetical protein
MRAESPLYVVRIECPVCKDPNEFEAVKVGSYTESDRDSDFRPTGRTWRNPDYQQVNPLVYSMATCRSCFYTRELDGNYKNWQRDVTFKMYRQKTLREAHLKTLAESESPLKALGEHLDVQRYRTETAINKLLLGILDERLLTDSEGLNVARYYLRIAWLYREMGQGDVPQAQPQDRLRELRRRLGTRQEEWARWLEEARMLAQSLESEVRSPAQAELLGDIEARMSRLFSDWRTLLAAPPAGPETVADRSAYFEFAGHVDFLRHLRERWNEVPLCEADAIAFAMKYYIQFFEQSRSFPSPELEVQTAYLIGELAYRADQGQLASRYFNHAIRKGQQLMHEFQKDTQRLNYIRNLVEMSIEQGKKNRDQTVVEA